MTRSMIQYEQNLMKVTLERRRQEDIKALERKFTSFGNVSDFQVLTTIGCGTFAVIKLVKNPLVCV